MYDDLTTRDNRDSVRGGCLRSIIDMINRV